MYEKGLAIKAFHRKISKKKQRCYRLALHDPNVSLSNITLKNKELKFNFYFFDVIHFVGNPRINLRESGRVTDN